MDIGQLRVGKGYLMVTVGQQGSLKENLTELHIIVRTTGLCFNLILKVHSYSSNWDHQIRPDSSDSGFCSSRVAGSPDHCSLRLVLEGGEVLLQRRLRGGGG